MGDGSPETCLIFRASQFITTCDRFRDMEQTWQNRNRVLSNNYNYNINFESFVMICIRNSLIVDAG